MQIKNKVKIIPKDPGVYFFKNNKKDIIYIGKAKNIRNRVRSYFQNNKYQSPKNISMIKRINDIEWIVVRNEVEALLTEANLIKKHQPFYNVNLKDDKSFPFIRITNEPYPRVFITREIIKDGSKYFGPYTDVIYLRRTLKAIRRIFPVRSCDYFIDQKVINEKKINLCLDYHIKKCEGPCEGLVSSQQYNEMIGNIVSFLHGKTKKSEEYIQNQMKLASEQLRYEDAGIFRDQLNAIQEFMDKQTKINADFDDRDIIGFSKENDFGIVVIVRIRNGRIASREKLSLNNLDSDDGAVIKTVITQFYFDTDYIPPEICVQYAPNSIKELTVWLKDKKGKKVKVFVPQKGEKAKQVRLAYQNAKLLLGEWILNKKKRKDLIPKMIKQLQDDLQLKAAPRKIECFDISHLGGTNTVASMVSFVDGKAKKSNYRKYNITSVVGIDDFASIREVVFRRYKRVKEEDGSFPDLVVVDGGKGQLSMAVSALRELGLDYIPTISLAKKLEEVFVPGQSSAQTIHKQSPGLILLRRIRDEAHRFAIDFQRKKRNKSITKSVFLDIKGIGVKKSNLLLSKYKEVGIIASLSSEKLASELSVSLEKAKEIIEVAKKINS
ncbi:MAG: excinuclease ABC subunit UvrC [Candidatus Neomarinimicrobiota bacterium]|nr:MAG: excinuclease ABC subunit C [bacterium]|tara:strand:+ start:85 stop:1908 length:1824 start_codon:yes stop_codon:yes gene_type:complete